MQALLRGGVDFPQTALRALAVVLPQASGDLHATHQRQQAWPDFVDQCPRCQGLGLQAAVEHEDFGIDRKMNRYRNRMHVLPHVTER